MKIGAGFADTIYTEKHSFFHQRKKEKPERFHPNIHLALIPFCIALTTVVLLGKLFFIQIVDGTYYRSISDDNRLRRTIIHAPRGIITDRNGNPLVYNNPGFRIRTKDNVLLLTQEEALPLLARHDKHLEIDSLRYYPYKDSLSHIIGYIGEISEHDLNESFYKNYHPGDLVGKVGIEAMYESELKGQDGQTLIEVDATGKKIRTLGQTDPIPGKNITLTIDLDLQEAVYQATRDIKRGAVIVSKANGEILAMVSRPSFDANLFTQGKEYQVASGSAYPKLNTVLTDNRGLPLLDRVISGTYPPGSTFKLISAAAALDLEAIPYNYTVEDTGVLKVDKFSFANWYYTQHGKTDGTVDVIKAIKRSNDIFFYRVGEKLGVERLSQYASNYGLGRLSGIDLPGEVTGLVPTKEWKQKTIGESWYLGDDFHYGIGQGYVLTTPLQVNLWTQAFANSGILYKPHLLMNNKPQILAKNLMKQKTLDVIREGMIEACAPTGVAYPLFVFKVANEKIKIDGKNFLEVKNATNSASSSAKTMVQIPIACKTGTAEHGGEKTLPHAWITLFAPATNPEIVVTVLSEESGEGSQIAAPVARDILKAYFEGKNK